MTHQLRIAMLRRLGGKGRQERYSVDFLVNDKSLYSLTKANNHDLCGRFSPETPQWNIESEKVYTLLSPADINNDRVMVFVCPECGDLACGTITMRIHKTDSFVIWSDFAYENGYDDTMTDYESYRWLGPYQFTWDEYQKVIKQAANI